MADRLKRGVRSLLRLLIWVLPTRVSRVTCALLAIVAMCLCYIPGFNVLNYYSGLAIAIVGGFCVGLSNAAESLEKDNASLSRLAWGRLVQALFFATVPLVILVLNAFRVTNCDLWAGVAFYAVGPLATVLIASQWGLASRLLGVTRRRSILCFLALWSAWIGSDVVAFLTEPPIFAYNAFSGFFSGAVYDDLIRIDTPLLFFRLGNVAQLFLLLTLLAPTYVPRLGRIELSRLRVLLPKQWAFIGLATLVVGSMSGASGYLGYDIDRETIQAQLGGKISNDHIVLYYDQATIEPAEAALILEDQTFRLHQLETQFGDPYSSKINSYVYGSKKQKRRLMGAERTSIAKPWLDEVHLHRSPYGTGVVHHELAHVYFSQYTDHLLGVPAQGVIFPKMMLVEGAAMAVEFYGGDLTQHEWSAALEREGLAPPLDALLNPTSFWNVNPGRGYILAGSFIRWLIDQRGVKRFKTLYKDGDFEEAYGEPLETLLVSWKKFLKDQTLPEDAQDRARTRFGSPGVLKRVCPLVIPRLEADAKRAIDQGRWSDALKIHREIAEFMPQNPTKQLAILYSLVQMGELDKADAIRSNIHAMDNATEVMRSQADETLADGNWKIGERQRALRTYARLLERPLRENHRRSLWAKVLVITDNDLEPILGPYLLSPASDDVLSYLLDAIIDLPGDRMALYLAGRRFALERRHKAGISLLEESLKAEPIKTAEANELIEIETHRLLGRLYIRLRQFDDARRAYQEVQSRSTSAAAKNTAKDWLQRVKWLSSRAETGKN